jgi:hypothetical protein
MKAFLTAIFLLVTVPLFSQIKANDLNGKWTACNKDSLYYKSDTVVMYQDANYTVQSGCCSYVNWNITSKKKIKIENAFLCTEPGRLSSFNEREIFKLIREHGRQLITLKRGSFEIGRFQIISLKEKEVNRYPHYIKILTLKRL